MRKLSLIVAVLVFLPLTAQAMPLNELLAEKGVATSAEAGKLSYDNATRLEFDSATINMNVFLQTGYAYIDYEKASSRFLADTSLFHVPNARLDLQGDLLNKQMSFRVENDFAGEGLLEAWLMWNFGDDMGLKLGQYKVPFSRSWNVDDHALVFVQRGFVDAFFNYGYSSGASLEGEMDGFGYNLSLLNGLSDTPDNRMAFAGQLHYSNDLYGSRQVEGDYAITDGTGWTLGAAVLYGQGVNELTKFDEMAVNVDAGIRWSGLDIQAEYFYGKLDLKEVDTSNDSASGFYAHIAYFVVPQEWEIAYRFDYVDYDNDAFFKKTLAHSFAVNYYLNGHNMKVQTGVAWAANDTRLDDEDGADDMRFDLLLSGYF